MGHVCNTMMLVSDTEIDQKKILKQKEPAQHYFLKEMTQIPDSIFKLENSTDFSLLWSAYSVAVKESLPALGNYEICW